jgi:hypothetical protein
MELSVEFTHRRNEYNYMEEKVPFHQYAGNNEIVLSKDRLNGLVISCI